MDYRATQYLNKMFSSEFDKTVEKKMFDLGLAWGYYMVVERFRESFNDGDGNKFADDWLKELSKDSHVGQYIKEIMSITEREMTPSEKIVQEMNRRHPPKAYACWEGDGSGWYRCSLCDNCASGKPKYCSNCGSKMD